MPINFWRGVSLPAFNEEKNVRNRGAEKNDSIEIEFGQEIRVIRRSSGGGHMGGGRGGGMNHHNSNNNGYKRGANGCTINHIGLAHLAYLLLSPLFLIYISLGF